MSDNEPQPIFIVSDSSGTTGEGAVRAALAQFENFLVNIRTYGRLAARENALIVYTLVKPEVHAALGAACATHGVDNFDLMGPLLARLAQYLGGRTARGIPGARTSLSAEYFRRIEAVEFTVKHDDGAEPRHLRNADIVLTGVSRTSKTPVSTYLAQKGWKVANVPLVLGIDPPPELFEIDQTRIFGLTIEPDALHGIRMTRIRNLGLGADSNYGHLEHILMELEYAHEIFRRNPTWPVVDVTSRAVEETATVILKIHDERRKTRARETTIRG
jgi:regulator of PEP synthase PpsR (kinase-PPPase family)